MTIILDGVELAKKTKLQISEQIADLKGKGVSVGLGTILVGDDPGSVKYVAGKHQDCQEVGIDSIRIDLQNGASEQDIIDSVLTMNNNPKCSGFIVQLPLPKGINQTKVLEMIDPKKDADGLHPYNLGSLLLNIAEPMKTPLPCTPFGILTLIQYYLGDDYLNGKNVCVLGRGITVGRTIGALLTRRSINATVDLCHTGTVNLTDHTKNADVIIAAIGNAHFLQPDMIKNGVVLIDVGVSRGDDGKIKGDIDPACYAKCSAYSPNPRGVGPMTRAMLLANTVNLATTDFHI